MGDSFQGLQLNLGKAEDDIFFADLPFLWRPSCSPEYCNRAGTHPYAADKPIPRSSKNTCKAAQ
jgi:hypothetical protein